MITRENKEKWVAALKSGKYIQGRYVLRDYESTDKKTGKKIYNYCPLGVLCDSVGFKPRSWYNCYPKMDVKRYEELKFELGNFEGIHKFYGLSPENQVDISMMNDRGDSFESIANWIKRKL